MNRKKEELHRIVELTVSCCNTSKDGQDNSIDDILGEIKEGKSCDGKMYSCVTDDQAGL